MRQFFVRYKILFIVIAALILIKVIWVSWSCWDNGSFESEKNEILQRRNYLIRKTVVNPICLLREMPSGIGLQYQGEWALYSCSMCAMALANIAELYPETRNDAIATIDSLITIVKSPEIRLYDKLRWREDPLESLDSDKSHVSYLSHLAWIIGNYKRIGGGNSYDMLYDSVCMTMSRRIMRSPLLNIPTYPDEPIYMPDMLVAIVALSDYAKIDALRGKCHQRVVNRWLERAKKEWLDERTGLLVSLLSDDGKNTEPLKGSYSALNCYYLTLIDTEFAKEQYANLKKHFGQSFPICGIKEYYDESCWFGLDIDAGPIIFNLSPSGTAFAIGLATFFEDVDFRKNLLKTAEIAGHSIKFNNERHYVLADIALVGEAITLAMRTTCPNAVKDIKSLFNNKC